ncbi:Growth/differentiation factor 6 [Collichthys lucidus]|uniref:Growth/differentiation factor 6 n=1 Tax=Collichthys lucidus TaxID=240159 RepID=A0A4V6XYX0_COLLU|nr:Growth/differentiation factor 6 [Collichthys lucidus]TKS84802.1 Growth/differentiation factor 6 [Collichthys lucidus]
MSFTFVVMMMLLGSSVANAFVLQPSGGEPAVSANSPVSHQRALNLQVEPDLPAGGLDAIREQWRFTISNMASSIKDTALPAVSGYSVSPDGRNSTSLTCCATASEIFMTDLGWDNWVIYPASLTIIQCALCNPEGKSARCPSSHTNVLETGSKVTCCQPTSQTMVPVVYVDEFSVVTISSVHLTDDCGCGHGTIQQPGIE